MTTQIAVNRNLRKKKFIKRSLYGEETDILDILQKLKSDLDCLYSNLDYVTDPVLIDSYIYEMKAIHMKYQYYLTLCKEKEIYEKRA